MELLNRLRPAAGFTKVDLLILLGVLVVLWLLLMPALPRPSKGHRFRIQCLHNQKQLVLGHLLWANDKGGQFVFASTNDAGSSRFADSQQVFQHYRVLSNELVTPKIIVCPIDKKRKAANDFAQFSNANVSYFVGLDSNPSDPHGFLSGDRNLTNASVNNGFLIRVTKDTPLAWTSDLHNGAGNIGLADGSVQQYTTKRLLQELANLTNTPFRLAFP
jgi:prepilin-type processing-associated H-X9-DG protein